MRCTAVFAFIATLTLSAVTPSPAAASPSQTQAQTQPGRRIEASDGDVIVTDHDARVGFVRRRRALIRLLFHPTERWVVLLADFVPANGTADGFVDHAYHWRQVEGRWPVDERWEGNAILEDYVAPHQAPPGFGLVLPSGRLQFLQPSQVQELFTDPQALAVVRYRGGGNGGVGRLTFDQAEVTAIENARRTGNGTSMVQTPAGSASMTVSMSQVVKVPAAGNGVPSTVPVRVGANVAMPKKVHEVPVVYPEAMRASGVSGIVLLEAVIDRDGSVSAVKVLRGLAEPLDAAALDAVKQWRYEPTVLAGTAVPVVLTVPVPVRP
jgi:TonB family protein